MPRFAVVALSAIFAITLPFAAPAPASAQGGDYTPSQARRGRDVYTHHCAKCHGSQLKGQAGPALAGKKFQSSIEFSGMSAKQLLSFISMQMPYDKPGSLSQTQYEDVLAYILRRNGYPAGTRRLTKSNISRVRLLPYPGKEHSESSDPHPLSTLGGVPR